MTQKPVIAIPCRYDISNHYSGRNIEAQNVTYIQAIVKAGGAPFLVPLDVDESALRVLYNLADGVLLTGGGDINPARYGQDMHPATADIQDDRDRVEITLARWAAVDDKPLLGICRGFQVMAVAAGGELCQDIAGGIAQAGRHDFHRNEDKRARNYLAHAVQIDEESRPANYLQISRLKVNSLHHQSVKTLPAPYQIVGRAADNIPEVIDLPSHPFYCGVQWHPEELVADTPHAPAMFAAFIETCRQRMA